MSINCILKLKTLGMLFLFLSLTALCSCDAGSSGTMYSDEPSAYAKKIRSKYSPYEKGSINDRLLVDDTQITVSTGNFWDRLRGSFQLAHQSDNPKVKAQIQWFIKHQGYLNRSVKRASPYIYYIFEQVQKRNLPGELVLLPFVESAFNPFAYSGPGAAGLWQLMPHTGTGFGLKKNWWYDGRRDVHASTNAALDYLTYLQNFFDGDWMLAIAAYNTGEGNVQHAVRRNAKAGLSTNFFSLGLAQETQAYVPQILALATIISNPQDYPIKLPPVRDEPYLAEVNIGYQIDLTEAAHLACISCDEIHRLNPAYMHKLTGPRSPCCLLLPIDHVEIFKTNLAKLSVVNQTTLQKYKVKRRETVDSIAARFQVSSYKLRRINHLKTNTLRAGKTIFVPVESPRITGNVQATENIPTKHPSDAQNVSDNEPVSSNSINVEKSEQSEVSKIIETSIETDQSQPVNEIEISSTQSHKILHRVKRGETIERIAAHYHVRSQDLRKWNHLAKKARLKPGKTLVIVRQEKVFPLKNHNLSRQPTRRDANRNERKLTPKVTKGVAKQRLPKSKTSHVVRVSYKVKRGDNLPRIARKYHVGVTEIKRWNHLSHDVRPGQVLTIYTGAH